MQEPWFSQLGKDDSWARLWSGYITCKCGGIRRHGETCSACQSPMPKYEGRTIQLEDGTEQYIPPAFAGAEGRYEDWVYLIMLEEEWFRPITDKARYMSISENSRPSPKAVIVLIFWTYFETRIDRLFKTMFDGLPEAISADLLQKYSSVGSRLDRLYKIAFGTTYWADLEELHFAPVADLLKRTQQSRNAFMHGHPEAINDSLVEELILALKDEHESWVSVFNRRKAAGLKPK